jgi:galactokinase
VLGQLGELMDQSMASCDGEFDCSSDELNELAVICREEGAIGSRLTGAYYLARAPLSRIIWPVKS